MINFERFRGFDDRQMDSLTDIGDCRVVFATEEDFIKKKYQNMRKKHEQFLIFDKIPFLRN